MVHIACECIHCWGRMLRGRCKPLAHLIKADELSACAGVRLAVFDAAKKLVESAEAAYAEELERAAA